MAAHNLKQHENHRDRAYAGRGRNGRTVIRRAFGRALRKLRLRARLSQRALGFNRGHISEMESGQRDPKLTTLQRLAERLHVSFKALTDEIDRQYQQLTAKTGAVAVHVVDLEAEDGILQVTVGGTAEFHACLQLHREVLDAAQQQQIRKVLLDCQDVDGDVIASEQDQIAGEVVVIATERKIRELKLAMVGRPPTVDGHVSRGLCERGIDSQVFGSVKEARAWLDQI